MTVERPELDVKPAVDQETDGETGYVVETRDWVSVGEWRK